MEQPKTLQQAMRYFSDEQVCIDTVAKMRWPNGPVMPCLRPQRALLPEDSKTLEVQRVLQAIHRQTGNHLRGFSAQSRQVAGRSVDAGQLQERHHPYEHGQGPGNHPEVDMVHDAPDSGCLAVESFLKIGSHGSEVEADETFIGGKARNMHISERKRRITGTGGKDRNRCHGHLGAWRKGPR